jgi:hypothetical protein
MVSGVSGWLLLPIYLLRLDRVVGFYVDDAWYVLLAKALATGQGYTLINSPSPGIVPFYPPAFAWLLSLVFRLSPEFPQNVWLLKAVSIAAMAGVGVIVYRYIARERELSPYLAWGIAVATVIHPAFVFLATSTVMSECVFTLILLAALAVIERGAQESRRHLIWRYALPGAALASAAFLTRSAALALLVAAPVYLLKKRLWRQAAIFVVGAALFIGPWMIYTRMHAPTAEQQAEQNSYIIESYATQFWQRKAGYATSGTISLSELPARLWGNVMHILEYDGGALILYPVYRAAEPHEARGRESKTALLSLALCLLALAGFVAAVREKLTLAELVVPASLMITVAWPFGPFRFLLPLLPLAIFYVLLGIRALYRVCVRQFRRSNPKVQWVVLGSAVGGLIVMNLGSNVAYILSVHGLHSERPAWMRAYEENEAIIKWVGENLPQDAVLATQNPALIHLYTGHKTVGSWEPARNWENWKRLNVRYGVFTSPYRLKEPSWAEKRYSMLYCSNDLKLKVLDFGEKSSRLPWIDNP